MIIRTITRNDLEKIVEIHLEAFSGFFLTSLGPSFLRQYYKSFIGNNEGISLCAEDNNQNIVGFCVGTTNSVGFHKRLIMKNFIGFISQFFVIMVTKPRAILRLASNLEKHPEVQFEGITAELLSIGVSSLVKGTGVGNLLLKRFEEELKDRKVKQVALTTDYYENDRVIGFYNNSGYRIICDFFAYPKRRMYKMIKQL
jgi:ribosomal protein S18 acetylase RimI-like enzyme